MEKYTNEIGVDLSDVIAFQTRLMMGAQYERVKAAKNVSDVSKRKKEILVACLRLGWNDAFRHTSRNIMDGTLSVLKKESINYDKKHKHAYDDYICAEIIGNEEFYTIFRNFALAASTDEKRKVIKDNWTKIIKLFKKIKEVEGENSLCFGHFQKMFNMALKLYLCLYICKDALELEDSVFDEEILLNMKNADCPVDSIILSRLDQKINETEDSKGKKYSNIKWSKIDLEDGSYAEIQMAIDKMNYKSRLSFDFKEWN